MPRRYCKGCGRHVFVPIDAREKIGRAKSVPVEEYPAAYEAIRKEMAEQIDAVSAKGGEQA